MQLALSPACPIFAPEHRVALHELLGTVVRRWHLIVTPDLAALRSMLPTDVWEMYGDYLVQAVKLAVNEGHGVLHLRDCESCDPRQLVNFCLAPAVVVVENAETDGDFLACVIRALRPRLMRALSGVPPRLDIRHAGGIGEVPKELRRLARLQEALMPSARTSVRRLTAMVDSDAPSPGALSADAQIVQRTAAELGLKIHILQKRAIENYIPDGAILDFFRTRTGPTPEAALIVGLRPPGRDHYPIKSGLKPAELAEQGHQYPGVGPGTGLGDFLAALLSQQRHLVDERGLRQRDADGELEDLLDLIEEHL